MIHKYLFCLMLFMFVSPKIDSQVFRITNNTVSDYAPKILKDLNNRVWCFWLNSQQQYYLINAKYFENEQWHDKFVAVDSAWATFNVSLDKESGLIWILVDYPGSLVLFKGQVNGFNKVATYYNNPSGRAVFDVIDSNNVWMDLCECWCIYSFYKFNGYDFEVFETDGLNCWVCDYTVKPKSSIVINSNKIYYLRDGDWHCNGGFDGPFEYLFYFDLTDSNFVENQVKYKENATAAVIGRDTSSFLYFFYKYPEQSTPVNYIDFVNTDADTITKSLSNINFFPQAATKNDTVCSFAWINDSTIFYKAINDTTLYKTKYIPVNELYNATSISDLRIESGVGRNIWLTWQGRVDNQYEIFVAREEISTDIDTDYITSVSLEDIESGEPSSFELFQNYPNPFNPSTSIRYTVISRQFVTLKVYDVLGNEIATLVNEEKSAGKYKVEFKGEGLTSGIYIYQLKAGNFIESKKMILLR